MNYFVTLALVLFVYMNVWFLVSIIKKRNDVADVAWGLGFVLLAWTSLYLSGAVTITKLLICSLVTIWGIRLSYHVYTRNRFKTEDYRYDEWRRAWGKWFYPRSYLQVYLLQGLFLYLIALPVLLINTSASVGVDLLVILGTLVWATGFAFESIGDAQLATFLKNPANRGKMMMSGLWAYTRHPNYFGEVTQWWGIWLAALSVPFGIFTIIGPLTITTLILKVSGIPLLEKKMADNPDFAEYKRRVSVFIPLPPKQ
jgi:steroid 5-alpha reductase family enzyme